MWHDSISGDQLLITSALTIEFNNAKTAKAVNNALLPDNVNLPRGMKIKQELKGKTVKVTVSVETLDSFPTLISTLDEFVTHIHVAVGALQKSQEK